MKLNSFFHRLIRSKNQSEPLNPASIDLKHIWAVAQSWIRSLLPVPKHVKEQIEWRRKKVKELSPRCWVEGHCIQCGCEILGKTKADMGCENEPYCYPEMMSKQAWADFQKAEALKKK